MTEKAKRFVRVWNASVSAREAAKELGMRYGAARETARRYRAKGYPVKHHKFSRYRPKHQVSER